MNYPTQLLSFWTEPNLAQNLPSCNLHPNGRAEQPLAVAPPFRIPANKRIYPIPPLSPEAHPGQPDKAHVARECACTWMLHAAQRASQ